MCNLIKLTLRQFRRQKLFTMDPETNVNIIEEGPAKIYLAHDKVFYNRVQEFNRDISVSFLKVFIKHYKNEKIQLLKKKGNINGVEGEPEIEVKLLEALAATGLRSIRYAKEVQGITKIVANDLSESAVRTMTENMKHNEVDHLVETSKDDACMLMYRHKHPSKRFAIVDIDPYGCPAIFLDAAVQCVADGGVLLVTATDMAVLAGNCPETCYSKYGAISLKTKSCHEMALRILLQCVEGHANRYNRYIEPLMSISADFYIRVFVKIHSGSEQCKKTTSKLSMVYQCVGCDNKVLQPLGGFKPNPTENNSGKMKAFLPSVPPVGTHCVHCNQKHHLGGPIWSAPIHDRGFVLRVLDELQHEAPQLGTLERLKGLLSMLAEELEDQPLYFVHDKLFGAVHMQPMPMMLMRSAIMNAGYKVSYSHACKQSIKTDAPAQVIWDIVRTWGKMCPVKPVRLERNEVTRHILSQEPASEVDLTERKDANPPSRSAGYRRFHVPPAHWGPGVRSAVNVGKINNEDEVPKSKRNQNKRSHKTNPDRRSNDKRLCADANDTEDSESKKLKINMDDTA